MITISHKRVEQFVKDQQSLGNDVRWDGWDLVFFQPSERAVFSAQGVYRNGRWGKAHRVSVNSRGTWEVDYKHVRRARRT